jgi:hypothetical protein
MKHFWATIPGWCDFADLYRAQVQRIPAGGHIVEVGAFLGKSAAYLAVEIANSGKRIQFDTCDTWQGVQEDEAGALMWGVQQRAIADHGSIEAATRAHLAPVADLVTLRTGHSLHLAGTYHDASLDFVFLDDCHDGPHVYAELEAWWPKLKPGGVLAGHDFAWPEVRTAVTLWAQATGLPVRPVSTSSWAVEKPVPATTWTRPAGERRALVAVACNERTIGRDTAHSLLDLAWHRPQCGTPAAQGFSVIDVAWEWRHVLVSDLRDALALAAVDGGYSHLVFLDADMVWPTDVVSRLLAHHAKGIVSGLYLTKKWPHHPVAMRRPIYNDLRRAWDYYYDEAGVDAQTLRPVDLVGMGCTIIPVEVFRRFTRPWFKYLADASGFHKISEDVWFCQAARAQGCPIWLDPTIVCKHDTHELIGLEHFERAQIERQGLEALRAAQGRSPHELADAGVE